MDQVVNMVEKSSAILVKSLWLEVNRPSQGLCYDVLIDGDSVKQLISLLQP